MHCDSLRCGPRCVSWQLYWQPHAQRMDRTHGFPAFTDSLSHLGTGPQSDTPRLHQPEALGLCVDAVLQNGIRLSSALAALSGTGLPFRPGSGALLCDRDLVATSVLSA